MAFDFLRKRKKYPANQAAKPPRPSEEPAAVYAGPPSGIRRHAPQADERGVSRRLYAGPPPEPREQKTRPPEKAVPVYAGPPPRGADSRPPLEVYAGPPPWDDDYDQRRSRMDPVYAGPPPKDDEEDEEDGPGPVPSLIYAGPEDLT